MSVRFGLFTLTANGLAIGEKGAFENFQLNIRTKVDAGYKASDTDKTLIGYTVCWQL